MENLIAIVVSATTGAIVAYLAALWQGRQGTRSRIHERIHETRARLYKEVWKKTGILPRRPTPKITYGEIAQLGIDLMNWYYEEGGMYLSGGSRRAYTAAQDTIEVVQGQGESAAELSLSDYEVVRRKCSDLRTALTRDLLSRSRAPTGKKWKSESI